MNASSPRSVAAFAANASQALLFTGPRGVGKFTLARMFAQAGNCERLRDDFCGECPTCLKIARLADPAPLIEAGMAERGESADAAAVERIPLILETHPDVWLLVPDPVRRLTPVARPMIRVGQFAPFSAPPTSSPRAAGASSSSMAPTRCAGPMRISSSKSSKNRPNPPPSSFSPLRPIPCSRRSARAACNSISRRFRPPQSRSILKDRTEWKPPSQACRPARRRQSRRGALEWTSPHPRACVRAFCVLSNTLSTQTIIREIFAATAQLSKQEKESFENVLELFYSLFTDLLEISQDPKNGLIRNPDLRPDLERLGKRVDFNWVLRATQGLDKLEGRLRRNIGRQLGLDALAHLATKC